MKQTSLSNTGHSLHCSILAAVNDPGVRSLISRELEEDALLFVRMRFSSLTTRPA